MNPRLAIVVVSLTVLATPRAFANDTTAELATGGLVFARTPDIEMGSEDLFISTRQIRVTYRFFNHSARDVTTLVAFPMPDITVAGPDDNIAVPTEDPENILGFSTAVDGVPVQAQIEQKVLARGVDRTELLRSLGIPLQPHLEATNQALDRLAHDKWDEFIRLGLAATDEYDDGHGMVTHLEARWTLKTAYFWRQTFPARRELRIEHRYQPSVGGSAGTALGSPGETHAAWFRDYLRKYCIDPGLIATLTRARLAANSSYSAPYTEQRISYVLTTGANWAGPIRDFRIVVDKGTPDRLVSFCGQGVRKIGPAQFEIHYKDFTPARDFDVLILTKYKSN